MRKDLRWAIRKVLPALHRDSENIPYEIIGTSRDFCEAVEMLDRFTRGSVPGDDSEVMT